MAQNGADYFRADKSDVLMHQKNMQNKLNNQEKNYRVNVGKINNGTCVVLLNNMQRFSDKTNPLETLQSWH